MSTSLSGGGQSGTSISVPTGTAVTDTATLSGTNAATATGTVTYNVYTDSGCTTLASGGGGTAETISTPGTLPASSPVTLDDRGGAQPAVLSWARPAPITGASATRATRTTPPRRAPAAPPGKSPRSPRPRRHRQPRSSRRGLWSTAAIAGAQFGWGGPSVTVYAGTSLTDTAGLIGTNAPQATGTVTYSVYTRQFVAKYGHRTLQWVMVANAGAVASPPARYFARTPSACQQACTSGKRCIRATQRTSLPRVASVLKSRSSSRCPRCYAWHYANDTSGPRGFFK